MSQISYCRDEQIKLIMECRTSGLSDYQWCHANGIKPGTFYNWVSKHRKKGYTFPDSNGKIAAVPVKQEVVKLPIVNDDELTSDEYVEQNATPLAISDIAAEIQIGSATIRFHNGADPEVIRCTLQCIGGAVYAG